MTDGLKHKTISSVRFTILSGVIMAANQTVSMVVLARLLTPLDYGLVAVGLVLIQPIQHILLNGLERACVLMPEIATKDMASVRGLNLLFALGASAFVASAGLIALTSEKFAVYSTILLALSPLVLIDGLAIGARAVMRLKLAYRELAYADMISQVMSIAVTITAAWAGWGPYSLVVGYTLRSILQTTMNVYNSGTGFKIAFSISAIRPLVSALTAFSSISVAELVRINLPPLFIGGSAGPVALGYFNRGYLVVQMPVELLLTSMNRVLYGSLVLVREDLGRLQRGCQILIEVGSTAMIPFCFGVAAASPEVVHVLLGSQWTIVTAFLPIVSAAALMDSLGGALATVSASTARFKGRVAIQAIASVVAGLGLYAANKWFHIGPYGLTGDALAVASGSFIYISSHVVMSARVLQITPLKVIGWMMPAILCGVALAAMVLVLRHVMAGVSPGLLFATEVAACAIGQFALYAIFWRRELFDIIRFSGVPLPLWIRRFQPG